MILTCPECATRYFVDEASIGPAGRKVRCAGCGHAWREAARPSAPDWGVFAVSPLEPAMAGAAGQVVPPVRLARVSADVSSRMREEAVEKRKTREAAAVGAVWAVLGAGFCVLALSAVVFRADVVRLVPSTAGAYAFARMPVNPVGLAIDSVQGSPALLDGHAALRVSGVIRNVETAPRDPAPLRVLLLDKAAHKLSSQLVVMSGAAPLQPGETRPFSVAFIDPPLSAASAQAEFAFDAIQAKKPPAPRPAAPPRAPDLKPSQALKLRDAAPVPAGIPIDAKEVAPLPASSPYALPAAAKGVHG